MNKKTFLTYYQDGIYESIESTKKHLLKDYQDIIDGLYSDEEIISYALELLLNSNYQNEKTKSDFFVIGDINTMPSDARIDYVYIPTYISAGIIMKASLLDPTILDRKNGSKNNEPYLFRILNGCIGRNFEGHGYDAQNGLLDALEILCELGACEFINKYPKYNGKFTNLLQKSIKNLPMLSNNNWDFSQEDRAKKLYEIYGNK